LSRYCIELGLGVARDVDAFGHVLPETLAVGSGLACLHGLHAAARSPQMADDTRRRGPGTRASSSSTYLFVGNNEASPLGFRAFVTATTLESRPRRRYVATLQFAKGHPCSMSH
jgi:hypothetical protein